MKRLIAAAFAVTALGIFVPAAAAHASASPSPAPSASAPQSGPAAPAAPATPFIPSAGCTYDHACHFENFDYSGGEIAWGSGGNPGNYTYSPYTNGTWNGDWIYVGAGTNQTYQYCYNNTMGLYCTYTPCIGYNNSVDDLLNQTCNGATYQQWQSQNTSHGWLIWSTWFRNAYPNWCGPNYMAVVTTDGPGGRLYLACPQGGVQGSAFGIGQFWAANLQ
jgi:hypothetical protein